MDLPPRRSLRELIGETHGATEWKLEGIAIDGTGLSTRGGPPGRLMVRAKLNGTPIAFDVGAVDLAKGVAAAFDRLESAVAAAQ